MRKLTSSNRWTPIFANRYWPIPRSFDYIEILYRLIYVYRHERGEIEVLVSNGKIYNFYHTTSPRFNRGEGIVKPFGNKMDVSDVGSSHPGAGEGPKGPAVRRLKWYASWVQNVVRQFGLYPVYPFDI